MAPFAYSAIWQNMTQAQWVWACRTTGSGAWRRHCILERKEDPQFRALNRAMSPHCAEAIDVDGGASAIGRNSQ
jgi:hypothetical protein